jgi:hypothetical protein
MALHLPQVAHRLSSAGEGSGTGTSLPRLRSDTVRLRFVAAAFKSVSCLTAHAWWSAGCHTTQGQQSQKCQPFVANRAYCTAKRAWHETQVSVATKWPSKPHCKRHVRCAASVTPHPGHDNEVVEDCASTEQAAPARTNGDATSAPEQLRRRWSSLSQGMHASRRRAHAEQPQDHSAWCAENSRDANLSATDACRVASQWQACSSHAAARGVHPAGTRSPDVSRSTLQLPSSPGTGIQHGSAQLHSSVTAPRQAGRHSRPARHQLGA